MQTFRQNPLMAQVFYNMLIEPLTEVQQGLQSQRTNNQEIIMRLLAIKQKLEVNDWHPFPHYHPLKKELKLEEKVDGILIAFVRNSAPIKSEIESLMSLAHLLSFIDMLAKPDHLREGSLNPSELFKFFSGYKEFLSIPNCRGQMSYSVNEKIEAENFPLSERYSRVIKIVNLLLEKGNLEAICADLFKNPECDTEISESAQKEIRSLFQDNLFDQATANEFIKEARSYKKEFSDNMQNFAVTEESASDFSPRQ